MRTCNDCLHQYVCQMHCEEQNGNGCSECRLSVCRITPEQCPQFKDKSKYVEQKHGRWEAVEDRPHMIYACSQCGDQWNYGAMLHCNYCPDCGAKMDEEDSDER